MNSAITKFIETTKFDLNMFLIMYSDFMSVDYPKIKNYILGVETDIPVNSYQTLKKLTKDIATINSLIEATAYQYKNLDAWELLDSISKITESLNTTNNINRWLQVNFENNYSNKIEENKILQSGETFEEVSSKRGTVSPQDEWQDITIKNLIQEPDYSTEGGTKFKITLQETIVNSVPTVIDITKGLKILGKDIVKEFTFNVTINGLGVKSIDLNYLKYYDALLQAFNILLPLTSGDIPEEPNLGLPVDTIGSDLVAVQYPVLFRNISENFDSDPRWKGVELLGIEQIEDSIFIKIKATSILNQEYNSSFQV